MPRLIRKLLLFAAVVLMGQGCVSSQRTRIPAGPGFMAKVVGVSDGDTITVLQGRRSTKVRLYGIDSPESHQAFGAKAKEFTSSRVFDRDVRVEPRDRDRYGRTVALVWPGPTSLNEELVKAGLAWAYRQYSEDYVGQEAEARKAHRGLWGDRNPVPPWDFRRRR